MLSTMSVLRLWTDGDAHIATILGNTYRLFASASTYPKLASRSNTDFSISCDYQACALLGILTIERFQDFELEVRMALLLSLLA